MGFPREVSQVFVEAGCLYPVKRILSVVGVRTMYTINISLIAPPSYPRANTNNAGPDWVP